MRQRAGGAIQNDAGMVEDFLEFATRTVSAIFKTARRARLTAASVGKASASSGSSKMRLEPARYRLAYLPRTPPFIEAKSYSGRMSLVDLRLFFFIKPSFVGCGSPGADDPNQLAVLGVRNHEKAPAAGHPNGQETRLISGMIVIWKRGRKRIIVIAPFIRGFGGYWRRNGKSIRPHGFSIRNLASIYSSYKFKMSHHPSVT